MFYLALITPLVAGAIAIYAIFPDLFAKDAKPWRRLLAAGLILLGAITSGWSAYSAAKDQKYLASWQAIGAVHDSVSKIWRDFQLAMFDPNRMDQGLSALKDAQELIKLGRLEEAKNKTEEISRFYSPDKEKLTQVIKELDELPYLVGRPGVSYDLKYRAMLFAITVKTLALRNSKSLPISPSLLFAAVAAEERQHFEGKLTLTPEWSQFLWYTGYFRPSDFAPPRQILSVDGNGRLVIDSTKFDEDFLTSRAVFMVEWFESVTQ